MSLNSPFDYASPKKPNKQTQFRTRKKLQYKWSGKDDEHHTFYTLSFYLVHMQILLNFCSCLFFSLFFIKKTFCSRFLLCAILETLFSCRFIDWAIFAVHTFGDSISFNQNRVLVSSMEPTRSFNFYSNISKWVQLYRWKIQWDCILIVNDENNHQIWMMSCQIDNFAQNMKIKEFFSYGFQTDEHEIAMKWIHFFCQCFIHCTANTQTLFTHIQISRKRKSSLCYFANNFFFFLFCKHFCFSSLLLLKAESFLGQFDSL